MLNVTKLVNLVDDRQVTDMRNRSLVIIDIAPMLRRLNRAGKFEESVVESFITRTYAKAHSVNCVSYRLITQMGASTACERLRIQMVAAQLNIDPTTYLPFPREVGVGNEGVWILLRGNDLLMGGSHAIEKCWRSFNP